MQAILFLIRNIFLFHPWNSSSWTVHLARCPVIVFVLPWFWFLYLIIVIVCTHLPTTNWNDLVTKASTSYFSTNHSGFMAFASDNHRTNTSNNDELEHRLVAIYKSLSANEFSVVVDSWLVVLDFTTSPQILWRLSMNSLFRKIYLKYRQT